MQLNSFLEDVIGITKPWRIVSAEFDGVNTVDIELEYVKSQRPEAPDCPECGSPDQRPSADPVHLTRSFKRCKRI